MVQVLLDAMQQRDELRFLVLLESRALLRPFETFRHRLEVGELQLELEHVDVANRIDAALHVRDVGILERSHHERRRVRLADVPEEAVAEALAATRAAHQAGDIGKGHRRRDHLGWPEERGKTIEARVGHRHDAGIRLDGGEGVVAHHSAGLRHRVEERRLSGVGQADDPDGEAQILSSSNAVCNARTASRTRGLSMMQVTWISLVAIIWMLMSFAASAWKIFA